MTTLLRYEILQHKFWRNKESGQTVSIYGSLPYWSKSEAPKWDVIIDGFTIKDNVFNTVGIPFKTPFKTENEAKTWISQRLAQIASFDLS